MEYINKIFSKIYNWFDTDDEVSANSIDFNRILELEKKYHIELKAAGINTILRRSMFWAQLAHESGLKPISENLNYSASSLLKIFPKYFNPVTALTYARKPEMIANRVYANRMGNGNESSGDGWLFRGRGFIQNTGRDNYYRLSLLIGVNLMIDPNMLLNESLAMKAAILFWRENGLNTSADNGDIEANTKKINGGLNGYNHRLNLYLKISNYLICK